METGASQQVKQPLKIFLCGANSSVEPLLWPSGLVHWTHVLELPECEFESRPGRSRRLCP